VNPKKAPSDSDNAGARAIGEGERKNKRRGASLVVVYGVELGRRILLDQTNFSIGRSSRRDMFIDQEAVSRKHAEIVYTKGHYVLYDQRSRNGTRVNDVRVTECTLADGDKIQVGRTVLSFLSGPDVETRYRDQIYRLMTVDGLTGAYNKRYFGDALEREYARALRYERRLSLVLFDVDGFDQTLLEHGPIAADAVLRDVARAVLAKLRQQDILGRLDGGSFGILLPEIDLSGAITAAEKVRAIAEHAEVGYDLAPLSTTVSAGVATLSNAEETPQALLALAQAALQDAKKAGVNGLGISRDSKCPP
jgi:two-component system, cell cycle response regulator